MNENWLRWLQTSTLSVFNAYSRSHASLPTIPLFFDPCDDPTKRKSPYYLELRVFDQLCRQQSKTEWKIQQTVGIMIVVLKETQNIYNKDIIKGLVGKMFKSYNVLKKGNQAGDDNAYVTCMQPISDIRIFDLGITDSNFEFCVMERDFDGIFEE